MYKKIANAENKDELDNTVNRIINRFGNLTN